MTSADASNPCRFIFIFGFETPDQLGNNQRHGWDDEDSMTVCILAESEGQALSWGREVAERHVNELFRRSGISDFSWKQHGYAHWIEHEASRVVSGTRLPVLKVGEYLST